jgi:transmembrane sensor
MTGMNVDDERFEAALTWQAAVERDDIDWDAFTAWLDADSRNRDAFDQAGLLQIAITRHTPALLETSEHRRDRGVETPARKRRSWWIGGGMAVAATLAAFAILTPQMKADTIYQTRVGETRRIAMAGDILVNLGPASRLVAHRGDTNRLEITSGNATFDVRHDPTRTLAITAAGMVVRDIGTRFDVNVAGRTLVVAVAEGNLVISAQEGGAGTPLNAGYQFISDGNDRKAVSPVSSAAIGAWQNGQLRYNEVPLGLVAADLSRYTGRKVTIDPKVESRTFSGILVVGDGSRVFEDLASLAGIDYIQTEDAVHLGGGARR